MIEVREENLEGVKHIILKKFVDERGFFSESYRQPLYKEMGISTPFV